MTEANRVESKAEFAGRRFDAVELADIVAWARSRSRDVAFEYVVTPNVDHLVRLDRLPPEHEAHSAYACARWCVCDSQIVRALARLGNARLTIVRGSDLTQELLADMPPSTSISVIGGDDMTLDALRKILPRAAIAHHAPPMGLIKNQTAMDAAVAFIEANPADLVFFAVGSPQQELLAYRTWRGGKATGTGFCIGAAIEFAVGQKARAPGLLRATGTEWLFRLLTEPKRLWRRYLVDDIKIFPIAWRWLRSR